MKKDLSKNNFLLRSYLINVKINILIEFISPDEYTAVR